MGMEAAATASSPNQTQPAQETHYGCQNLPPFPLTGFAQLIPQLCIHEIQQINRVLQVCDFSDDWVSCRERAVVITAKRKPISASAIFRRWSWLNRNLAEQST